MKPKVIARHLVAEVAPGTRIYDYARGLFIQLPTRASLKKALSKGRLILNATTAKSATHVNQGDLIELLEGTEKITPYHLDLPIIYQDQSLAVIHKPAGIPVSGNQFRCIQNALPHVLAKSAFPDALRMPRPVHRLDAATQGLLLVGRSASALVELSQQFEQGQIKKLYAAIINGKMEGEQVIDKPLDGKVAITGYKTIQVVPSLRNGHLSLLELSPQTGRTHQLRKHLSGIGHPIVGDKRYGIAGSVMLHKGLFLAAVGLSFLHPETGAQMSFNIPIPPKFGKLMERETRRWKAYQNNS